MTLTAMRPTIRGSELTLHLALHILRNPWPFDQRERDAVRLWAADELERLSIVQMQANLQPNPQIGGEPSESVAS